MCGMSYPKVDAKFISATKRDYKNIDIVLEIEGELKSYTSQFDISSTGTAQLFALQPSQELLMVLNGSSAEDSRNLVTSISRAVKETE